MVAHNANLSPGDAVARQKVTRMLSELDDVAAAFTAGEIGVAQVRLLAKVYANRRVRDLMCGEQDRFLLWAGRPFHRFEAKVREWERLMDDDGPDPAAEASHEKRNFTLVQDYNLTWNVDGRFGALQGASIDEIVGQYVHAEWLADWEKARAEHGDAATDADLPRTPARRRADAFWQMTQDAAASPTSAVPAGFTHNIVWSADTFNEMASRVDGNPHQPHDPETFRCETIDGTPLDPTEAIATVFTSRVRRILIDAKSTVIDLGEARSFTGSARKAVKFAHTECAWIGCHCPTSRCETDHLIDHSKGGRTNPGNGAPLCGRHNRWKQKGFRVWRDPTGAWHTYRPDGTEIH